MSQFLTQAEYNTLMQLIKEFKEDDELNLNDRWNREVLAPETGDMFVLDFYRGRIEFKKFSINKRYKKTVILIRFCSHGFHTNPDGTQLKGPHLHLYKEGYDDKFAVDIKQIGATESSSMTEIMEKFLEYCKINKIPIKGTLF